MKKKRMSKKQWCHWWMDSFGAPHLSQKFYEYIGGKGPIPRIDTIEDHKKMVGKTWEFWDKIGIKFISS
jgi:hypothetical protein